MHDVIILHQSDSAQMSMDLNITLPEAVCAGGGAASLLLVGDSAPDFGSDTPDMTLDTLSGDSPSAGVSAAEFTAWY